MISLKKSTGHRRNRSLLNGTIFMILFAGMVSAIPEAALAQSTCLVAGPAPQGPNFQVDGSFAGTTNGKSFVGTDDLQCQDNFLDGAFAGSNNGSTGDGTAQALIFNNMLVGGSAGATNGSVAEPLGFASGNSHGELQYNTIFGLNSGQGNGTTFANLQTGNEAYALLLGNLIHGENSATDNGRADNSFNPDSSSANARAEISSNIVFADSSVSENGNGISISGTDPITGKAVIANNFVNGRDSVTRNGTAFDGNGEATVQNNFVWGNELVVGNGFNVYGNSKATVEYNFIGGERSGSFNAYDPTGDDTADIDVTVSRNFVWGDDSASSNVGNVTGNKIFGDRSGSSNGENFADNTIFGNDSAAMNGDNFKDNTIIGNGSGTGALNNVADNIVIGDLSGNKYGEGAQFNTAIGQNSGNGVAGFNNIAIGTSAGNGVGPQSNTIAIGSYTVVTQSGGVAIGGDSLGNGATSTMTDQFVLGTMNHTYTAPGIISTESKNRQSGPIELVTSDGGGNLATANANDLFGSAFKQIDQNTAGIALAIAMEKPDLVADENFGIAAHWGNFDGANALGLAGQAVLIRDAFRAGDRIAASAALGIGFNHGEADTTWGVRAGGQYTWR